MGISAEIFNGIAKSVKGFLDVGAPVFFIKGIAEFRPPIRIPEHFTGNGKCQGAAFVKRIKACEKFPFEFIPQDSYRDKEAAFGFSHFEVFSKPSPGNNAVHMHMVIELLVPGVEYLDNAWSRPKILLVSRKL